MDTAAQIFLILEDLAGTDEVRRNLDLKLFDEGLIDSFGFVLLLTRLSEDLKIEIPLSEIDRTDWATPDRILASVAKRMADSVR